MIQNFHRLPKRLKASKPSVLALLVLAVAGTSMIPAPLEGYYVARYKARDMLRKDCREIRRVARFYISSSCRLKLLSVRSLDIATPDFALEREAREEQRRSTAGAGLEVRRSFFRNEQQAALQQQEKQIAEKRNLRAFSARPQSLLLMVVQSKGILTKQVFTIVYRIRWTSNTEFNRKVIKVEKRRNINTDTLEKNIVKELREQEEAYHDALERPDTIPDNSFLPGSKIEPEPPQR